MPAVLRGTCLPLQQSRGPSSPEPSRSSSLSCRCDKDKVPSCWVPEQRAPPPEVGTVIWGRHTWTSAGQHTCQPSK